MKNLYFFFLLVLSLTLGAQNTVGLLSYQPTETFAGYNLIYPHNQPNVYLVDNCGEVVHVWEDEPNWRPGNTAYLLDDGRLVKTKRQASVAGNPIWAGGGGAIVEIRSWDNDLLWSFERNDENNRLHHDIAMTPQGTILMIVWEKKTMEEAMAIGRSPFLLSDGELWPDYVIEVDPTTDEIVWEWHVWDHLVQDIVPELSNFDVVGSRPERVNVNWETNDSGADWMHTNSIDFDPLNDQIILSVPTFNEFWIIDHSTSTAQAATSNGGLSGRGGDLMYRWGNPAAYQQGTEADQKLFYQHDVHIVDDLLPITHPYYGKIALFNNRVGADFSTANVLSLSYDMYEGNYPMTGSTWGPSEFDVVLQHPEPSQLYSTGLSSIQFLPNGNALIMDGRHGYAFELSPENEVVWEYLVPLTGGQPVTQGDVLEINNNLTFRMTRYPLDFGAFTDRDLTGEVWIEQSPDSTFCDFILPASELMTDYQLEIYPNPTNGQLTIEWDGGMMIELRLLDLLGRTVYQSKESGGRCYLSAADWHAGMYVVQINGVSVSKVVVR